MAKKASRGNAVALADLASGVLDPVMKRRAGVSVGLIQSWDEIVGPALAQSTRPERIAWPRRASDDDPFEPAALVIACEGLAALSVQHQTGEIIHRVNAFLGFQAVARVKIVQKPVRAVERPVRQVPGPLSAAEAGRLRSMTTGIEDAGLREALERLGRSVLGSRGRRP